MKTFLGLSVLIFISCLVHAAETENKFTCTLNRLYTYPEDFKVLSIRRLPETALRPVVTKNKSELTWQPSQIEYLNDGSFFALATDGNIRTGKIENGIITTIEWVRMGHQYRKMAVNYTSTVDQNTYRLAILSTDGKLFTIFRDGATSSIRFFPLNLVLPNHSDIAELYYEADEIRVDYHDAQNLALITRIDIYKVTGH